MIDHILERISSISRRAVSSTVLLVDDTKIAHALRRLQTLSPIHFAAIVSLSGFGTPRTWGVASETLSLVVLEAREEVLIERAALV